MIVKEEITGLILAGGRGMRMGQVNKGLQLLDGEPMVAHVLRRLAPQVGVMMINANQDLAIYAQLCPAVFADRFSGYAGPLAGLHCGLYHCTTPYLISVPCDSPFLPADLATRLACALEGHAAQIAVVTTVEEVDGEMCQQAQPVFSLVRSDLLAHLENFLQSGGRKVSDWYASLNVVEVAFDDVACFRNINTLDELAQNASPKLTNAKI